MADEAPLPADHASDDAKSPGLGLDWRSLAAPLIVFAVSVIAFLPALRNEFVEWDDDKLFLHNYDYRGLGPAQIRWMFTHTLMGHYQPLAWVTLGADYTLWGMNPCGYHLTSILLHAAGAVAVYWLALVILQLVFAAPPPVSAIRFHGAAAFAALLYGVHPLRVESVAWVTERRDVVCMFFLAPAVTCYARYATGRGGRHAYAAAVILHALALLSKAWAITLPAVLLVMDFHPLGRLRWRRNELLSATGLRALMDKAPFAALSIGAGLIAIRAQSSATMEPLATHDWTRRIAQCFHGAWFYLHKTMLPVGLSPLYELPRGMNPFSAKFLAPAILVVILSIALLALRRRWPSGLAAWLIYLIIVSPVLGLAQTGPQLVADRYTYIACLPFALLAGAALVRPPREGRVWQIAAVAMVPLMIALTWRQCGHWRDSVALWERCLAVEPDSWNAHNNLGVQRFRREDDAGAILHLEKSLAINPANEVAWTNLGSAYARSNRPDKALPCYREAAKGRARTVASLLDLANGFAGLGCYDEAASVYRQIVSLDSELVDAGFGLAVALERQGLVADAIRQYEQTLGVVDSLLLREGPRGPRAELLAQQYAATCAKLVDLFERRGDRERARKYFAKMQGG